MEIQLPQGTGSVKHTRPYNTMTKNQKFVYDLCYDEINGPLFFAENCCYVNRNGLEHYKPFDYQREMIFNMHNYKRLISLFSRQNGKCLDKMTKIKIRSKNNKLEQEITINDLFNMIKNNKNN